MRLKDKVVWITGASSGIGEALAKEIARRGNTVVISARREDELNRVAQEIEKEGGKADVLTLDLTKAEEFPSKIEYIIAKHKTIDVLVNNGGISQRSFARDTPIDVDRKMFEINFFGAVALTKQVLPVMHKQSYGQIVAVSSIVGFIGFSMRTAYSASKHAMKGFFESLRIEEAALGIQVNMVYPGSIQTNISKFAVNEKGEAHDQQDRRQSGGMPADQCARIIVRGMERNKADILVGRREVLLVYIRRYFPGLFYRLVARIKPT
jgi:dehydrogenase/reductase SDR family member 7B